MAVWSQGSFLLYGLTFFTEGGYKSAAKNFTEDISTLDLTGKSYLVTGANSGIGLGACKFFATQGGTVHMLCRSAERGKKAKKELEDLAKNAKIHLHLCDLSEMTDIRRFAKEFIAAGHTLDVLVNNAGVMLSTREVTSEGLCKHFATNTLSNFLLTHLMLPLLTKSKDPRVIIVSSGGMLTEPLLIRDAYNYQKGQFVGRTAYARTKRHQLVLTHKFAEKFTDIKFYATHPGWTETAAVQEAMPEFYNAMKDKLRTIEHGCDTINWLAGSTNVPANFNGKYIRDRQIEIEHFCISSTRYSPIAEESLWNWCKETLGMGPTVDTLAQEALDLRKALAASGHIKNRRVGLISHDNTFKGSTALASLKTILNTTIDAEALARGQLLIENGFFHKIDLPDRFIDSNDALYQFHERPTDKEVLDMASDDWVDKLMKLIDIPVKDDEWNCVKKFGDEGETEAYVRDMPPSKLKAVKVTTKTKATSAQLRELLDAKMIERNKEWNNTFSYGSILQYVSSTVNVQYWLFVQSPLDPREFVVMRRVVEFDDGGVAICEKTIEHGLSYPTHTKKAIRCDMPFQVRYWKPLDKDDPNSGCFLLQANQTDIKGWIPNSVANSANIDISYEEIIHIQAAALKGGIDEDGEQILKNTKDTNTSTSLTTTTTTTVTTTVTLSQKD